MLASWQGRIRLCLEYIRGLVTEDGSHLDIAPIDIHLGSALARVSVRLVQGVPGNIVEEMECPICYDSLHSKDVVCVPCGKSTGFLSGWEALIKNGVRASIPRSMP